MVPARTGRFRLPSAGVDNFERPACVFHCHSNTLTASLVPGRFFEDVMAPVSTQYPPPIGAGAALRSWSDTALLDEQRAIAAERRVLDARAAAVAGEIARRCVEGAGLAAREHARSAVDLVQRLTGGTLVESRALIEAGRMTAPDAPDWLSPVSDAVAAGRLGVVAASAISAGLGDAGPDASPADLYAAAVRLVDDAESIPVEKLGARARVERDLLDVGGVEERAARRRERRFLRLIPLDDGMTRIVGLLDTESAARVRSAFDQVTAPRRSGPRFVDPASRDRAERIAADPRTTGQLLLDTFVEIVERAVAADDGTVFGARRPGVRVHVAMSDLQSGTGAVQLEGSADAVPVATAQRIACTDGVLPILFDGFGRPLDVGRTQRLHTIRQRIAIAARDGGCLWPGCDRPPSWTEVHHPVPWNEGGETSIENGVSLCAHHHLLLHNEGWRVEHDADGFWLVPPPGRGLAGERMAMPSRNRVVL
jgi:hypothetical protein